MRLLAPVAVMMVVLRGHLEATARASTMLADVMQAVERDVLLRSTKEKGECAHLYVGQNSTTLLHNADDDTIHYWIS